MNHCNHLSNSSHHKQQGIATILMVVLIGLALTATSLSIMHSVRSTQVKQTAVHAATNAQTGVWAGVEAFRAYLGTLQPDAVTALDNTAVINLNFPDSSFGTMQAKAVNVTPVGDGKLRVSATIVNVQTTAKSSSAVGVVFEVNPQSGDTVTLSAALDFHDDMTATGQIEFDGVETVNVDGNVSLENINITALESLNATGNINLNSGVSVDRLHSNGNITLDGSASVSEIFAKGTVTTKGGATIDTIEADGEVFLGASGRTLSVDSLSKIHVQPGAGRNAILRTGDAIEFQRLADGTQYSNTTDKAYAVSTINVKSTAAVVNNIWGEGTLICPSSTWQNYIGIELNLPLDSSCVHPIANSAINPNITVPAGVVVDVMDPVPAFSLPNLVVDVFKLKPDANYILEPTASGDIQVTVNGINGEADGTVYYLGNYNGDSNKPDALCKTPQCTCDNPGPPPWQNGPASCTDPEKYLCLGHSANGSCVDYNASTKTFTFQGTGVAPGIFWIDGNAQLNTGYNNATMLVTGNISSNGQYRGAAVNFGYEPTIYNLADRDKTKRKTPYEEICQVKGTGLKESANHMIAEYKSRFTNRTPSNLCVDGAYTPLSTGNIALAAGGIRPVDEGGDGTYTGGDIKIGANSQVYGITLAGGYLETGGSAVFFGYVAAAVQGAKRGTGVTKNILSGNTKVILDTETDFYQPSSTTNMGDNTGGGGGSGSDQSSRLLWSKYL